MINESMFSVAILQPYRLKKIVRSGFGWLLFVLAVGSVGHAADKTPDPRFKLTTLNVSGNQSMSVADIKKAMKLKIPSWVRESRVQTGTQRLRDAYNNKGFLEVKISTAYIEQSDQRTLNLDIVEGSIFYVGGFKVEGNKEVSSATILREMEMSPGDPLNKGKLLDGNQRLYASGCFDLVDLIVSSAPANRINVLVRVHERQQRFLKGGVGYGSESKERVTAGFEDRNFLGGARRLDMKYTLSGFLTQPDKYRTSVFDTTVVQPYIFGTRMEGQIGYDREGQLRQAYDSISNTLHASLERRINAAVSIQGTYRFSGTHLTRVSPDAQTPSQTSIDAIGGIFRFDNTDDPFLPYHGWRNISLYEEGLELYRTDVGFHKFETRLGRFDTLDSGWTFFEGFQFGHIRAWSGKSSNEIPIYERYFLGGANSVRGYSERTLGPKDSDGNPLGGTLFVVGNFEIRHQIYKKLFGVVFFDAGNLFAYDPQDSATDVKIKSTADLKYSAGSGVRIHSPVGAIRLEVGYQLNPDGNPSTLDRLAVHFSIGEVF